jgi:hypothetical protein
MAKHDVKLLATPDLAKRVIELLSSKQALPSAGIVAGQAVASAIDELLGTGPAVYNDIDVFLEDDDWATLTGELFPTGLAKKELLASRFSYRDQPNLRPDDYAMAFHISSRTLYHVIKAERDRLLNLVLVKYAASTEGSRGQRLVEAFDLNSVQVGIDLKTGELAYTPQFEEFFVGRELRIVSLFTPFQSLLRYFKKRQEMPGTYGNDDLMIEMVRHIIYFNEGDPIYREDRIQAFKAGWRWMPIEKTREMATRVSSGHGGDQAYRTGTGVCGQPLAIGKKYATLLDVWMPKLEPYFEVWKHPRINVWLLTSRPNAPRLPYIGRLSSVPNVLPARFLELKLPAPPLVKKRRTEFQNFVFWLQPKLQGMYRTAYRYRGDQYLEGVESQQGWRDLQRVLNAHEEVVSTVINLPVGEQIALVRRVRLELKNIDLSGAWGIFRGKDEGWARKALADPAWLHTEVQRLLGSDEPLIPRARLLPLPPEIGGIHVRELSTTRALICEGARMRHCVGGYGDAVEKGSSRIVSLTGGDKATECSTFEWRREVTQNIAGDEVANVRLVQHYTFCNHPPAERLLEAEATLRAKVNEWLDANPDSGLALLYQDGARMPALRR